MPKPKRKIRGACLFWEASEIHTAPGIVRIAARTGDRTEARALPYRDAIEHAIALLETLPERDLETARRALIVLTAAIQKRTNLVNLASRRPRSPVD